MNEVELHPWHTSTTHHGIWTGDLDTNLEDLMARPGGEERLRSLVEPELAYGADLSDAALLGSTRDLLDCGRLVLETSESSSIAVDPRYPISEGSEDLGNLIDLMGDDTDEDDEEPTAAEDERPTWIEITVVDGRGEPICGRPYRLHLPDGTVRNGTLSDEGAIRFDDVDPGLCTLELPTADPAEWAPPGAIAA